MADEAKEKDGTDAKVNYRYSSTVFACDISSDTRYIRCDFPQCSEHGTASQAKPSWILNTLRNVRTLETHVGREVHNFMKAQTSECVFSNTPHKIDSLKIIESRRMPIGIKKVLAVFNLKDSQSQLGEWLDLFLKAAFLAEYGDKRRDFVVITQDFVSRYELMQCIARLEFLKSYSPKVEVVGILSSHSSCQGQVFSCTPTNISKVHGFEEFCSLHDVTLGCQDAFGDNLEGLHVSSCFTLKLDCSHEDWPVDASWFKNKLRCVLTGSTREVYETGSQVCDLHLLITTMLSPPIASFSVDSCGERLRKAVMKAQTEEFPDLAREMGLEAVNGQMLDSKLHKQGSDDKVSPPGLVISQVFVALLVEEDTTSSSPNNTSTSISQTLAEAVSSNLSIRKASDIRCTSMVLSITIDKISSLKTKSSLKEKLKELPRDNSQVFFVVLSPSLANPSAGLMEVVRAWSAGRGGNKIYGVHFQDISALQAYYIKNRLKEEVALSKYSKTIEAMQEGDGGGLEHIGVTGLVDNSDKNPHVALPVLLYLIHLAIGENGERLAGKGIPSGVYSKKPVGPGTSSWTLEEVYMETCHVLSGLARKCSLQVLSLPVTESAASTPVQQNEDVNGRVSIPVCTTDEKCVTLHEVAPFSPRIEPRKDSPLSAQKRRRRRQSLSSTPSPSGKSNSEEPIELTPQQERMDLNEVVITKVVQNVHESGEAIAPCSKKRKNVENEVSPAKRLANSMAVLNQSSSSCSNSSSPGIEMIQSTAERPPDLPSCFRNLDESFERESLSSSPSSSNKPETFSRSSTRLSDRADNCAANMSINRCSGVGKSPLKAINGSPQREKSSNSPDVNAGTISSNEISSPTLCGSVRSEVQEEILNLEGKDFRNVLDGDALIERVSAEVERTKVLRKTPGKLTRNESSSRAIGNHKVERVEEEDVDVEIHTEWLESEKRQNFDNSKGTQADFSPLDKNKYHPNRKQYLLSKIKRLQTQNNSSTQSNKQEKTRKRKVISKNKLREAEDNVSEDHEACEAATASPVSEAVDLEVESNGSAEVRSKEKGQDIPLLANVEEVHVRHYVLDLAVDFQQKVMKGSIVLFLEPANEEVTQNTFQLSLDSTLVNVESVSEVFLPEDFKIPFYWRNACGSQSAVNVTAVKSEDICSANRRTDEHTNSSDKKNIPSSSGDSELSLFQRLQKNYGIGSAQNECESAGINAVSSRMDSESSQINAESSRTDSKSSQINAESSRMDSESSRISAESSKNQSGLSEDVGINNSNNVISGCKSSNQDSSTLPGFLKMLGAKSSDPLPYKGLTYSVYGWCIKVWKEGATGKAWPRCVCIKYHTSPEGQSLMWTHDQDGKPCVFSPGAYINNRSLMPCQEPPVAMSTWQAAIHVPRGCMAYMSGCPVVVDDISLRDPELVTHYFEMDIALPCSTLALAVGWLPCREGPIATVPTKDGSTRPIPCRIVAAPCLIDKAADQLLHHIHTYIEAACELLGPYPFDRLDLLILPRCFACMGLKSPNLAFLSQSILASAGSLRLRVAHEISHAWFGLLIGAKDWTEEWLSEGFATYMEDTIQSKGEKWLEHRDEQFREIRQILRHRTLSSEMRETEKNMQCLRPKKSKFNVVEMAEDPTGSKPGDQPKPSSIIQYKCSKKWTQVHYLKGYFLLNYLANMVGRENFDRFLYDYVQHYQGQLVNSEDFFEFFESKFPTVLSQTVESIMEEWLERPGIPKCLRRKSFASKENVLVNQALEEFEFWRRQDATNKRNRTKNARHRKEPENFQLETSEQIVLMLEKLLERENLLHTTLRQLNKSYCFENLNAEIRHRWCELVVKHKFVPGLKDVRHFLIEDQGMGIYLFGELIISGQGKQRLMAEEIFAEIGDEMDRCTYKTVSDMLEGVE